MTAHFVTASDAVSAIPDGSTVAIDGFTMMGVAEAIEAELEASFLRRGHPRNLVLVHAAGQSNRRQGFEHFAHEGLALRVVGSHWGLMPNMSKLLAADVAQAVCLPQGQLSNLFRAVAAGRPGSLTRIGLGTFVDPRIQGGKVNRSARDNAPDLVQLLRADRNDHLLYRTFPIGVGIVRGTAADDMGNVSQEEEAVSLDALSIAQAVRNSGGLVICQVKERVPFGSIPPRRVAIPATLVDMVVIADEPNVQHRQTDSAQFDPRYISAVPEGAEPNFSLPEFSARLVIGRRAIRLLRRGDVVNIGTGIPGDVIGPALFEAGLLREVTLTVESGVYGGVPAGGVDFGIAAFPDAIISHAAQFDFYGGGGLDATFMGAGQIDAQGNVNVSWLGDRLIGCGGFIDITQTARRVIFCFSTDGRHAKWVPQVSHLTFSARQALENGQEVFYVSESALFELRPDGLHLRELSAGVSTTELLSSLPFEVKIDEPIAPYPDDVMRPIARSFNLDEREREPWIQTTQS